MKKRRILTALALCTVMVLGGCGKSGDSGKTKISISNWPDKSMEAELEKYEKNRDSFMKANPDIEIVGDMWSYSVDTFVPKASSNQLPNIYDTYFTETDKIIDAGYAADITAQMDKYGYTDAMSKDLLEIVSKDGKIYGVPTQAYIMGLYINLNVFKEAGLMNEDGTPKVPGTYDELREMSKTIKDKTGKIGFMLPTMNNMGGWEFMNIAWSYGTEFMKNEDGKWKATFASDECAEALQFVKDMKWKDGTWSANALVDNEEVTRMFATDQVGMVICEPEYFATVAVTTYGMNKDDISMAKLPAGPKGRYALLGGTVKMFSPNSTQEQLDACFKYLNANGSGPEVTEEIKTEMEKSKKINVEKGYVVGIPIPKAVQIWNSDERNALNDELAEKYRNIDVKLYESFADTSDVTIKAEEPMNCQELYKTLDNCLQKILTEESSDVKTVLKEAQDNFQKNYLDKVK